MSSTSSCGERGIGIGFGALNGRGNSYIMRGNLYNISLKDILGTDKCCPDYGVQTSG
jgi:hypothetical protein